MQIVKWFKNSENDTIFRIKYNKSAVFFLSSFGIGTISTIIITALYANAIIAADIAAYTLFATFALTTIGTLGLLTTTIDTKIDTDKDSVNQEGLISSTNIIILILLSILSGYALCYHGFIVNSVFSSLPLLEQAGIAAGFASILPFIGSVLFLILFGYVPVLTILISTALGTFSAIAMNIETGSIALNIAVEVSTGCAIAISSTVVLAWLFNSIALCLQDSA